MVVKQCILKNVKKPSDPYIRSVSLGYTGFDITYGNERQAMRFVTQNIAIMVRQDLIRYGDFYPIEVD